jgi:hypothetical protein
MYFLISFSAIISKQTLNEFYVVREEKALTALFLGKALFP